METTSDVEICMSRASLWKNAEKHTLETSWVGGISTDFVVDFDQALHDNRSHFTASQGIF